MISGQAGWSDVQVAHVVLDRRAGHAQHIRECFLIQYQDFSLSLSIQCGEKRGSEKRGFVKANAVFG